MSRDGKRDIIAVVLLAAVISTVILVTWMNRTANDTSEITRFIHVSERLNAIVQNYDSSAPVEQHISRLDPQTFLNAAAFAPDYGTANDLQYVAELIKQYNNGASFELLREASAILEEIVPYIKATV